jgi:streptomycin 6-kinase
MLERCSAIDALSMAMPELKRDIPAHLDTAVHRAALWGVTLEEVLPGATCSVVLAGTRHGIPVVLRVPMAAEEASSGLAGLRAFSDHGGIELLEFDEKSGTILMPRLLPGSNLEESHLTDEEKLDITARLSMRLQSAPNLGVWSHERWFQELWSFDLPPESPVDKDLFAFGRRLAVQLLETTEQRTVLHGDLHHYNILRDGGRWVALDAKGVWADPSFEPVAFLRNPVDSLGADPDLELRQARRIHRFAERMSLPEERIWGWAVAQIVLDAAWSNGSWSETWAKVAMATYRAGTYAGWSARRVY